MNMQYLAEFCTVVRFQNVTKAAEALFLSQPSLTRHVKELENELGVELIIRGNSKVFSLTKAGELLYEQSESLLKQMYAVENLVYRTGVGKTGSLMIASGMSYSYQLNRLVKDFAQKEDIFINFFDSGDFPSLQVLIEQRCDLCVAYTHTVPAHRTDIDYLVIEKDHLVAVISDLNPLAKRQTITVGELKENCPMIIVREPDHRYLNSSLNQIFNMFAPNLRPAFTFLSMILQVRCDRGFCILPYSAAVCNDVGCRLLEIEDMYVETNLVLVWNKEHKNTVLPVFLDFVQESLGANSNNKLNTSG